MAVRVGVEVHAGEPSLSLFFVCLTFAFFESACNSNCARSCWSGSTSGSGRGSGRGIARW